MITDGSDQEDAIAIFGAKNSRNTRLPFRFLAILIGLFALYMGACAMVPLDFCRVLFGFGFGIQMIFAGICDQLQPLSGIVKRATHVLWKPNG